MFSPDSKSVGWYTRARIDQGEFTPWLDGRALARSYDHQIVFSPDSRHVAYVARAEKGEALVVDGQEAVEAPWIRAPVYSPDSRRLVAVLKRANGACIFEAGAEGKIYHDIGPVLFSPGSRHLACWVEEGKDTILLVDGREILRGPLEVDYTGSGGPRWDLAFTEDKLLRGLYFRGREPDGRPTDVHADDFDDRFEKGTVLYEAVLFELALP